jgi:predicted RNase H-like nuclease (RuvC/YqgF family)
MDSHERARRAAAKKKGRPLPLVSAAIDRQKEMKLSACQKEISELKAQMSRLTDSLVTKEKTLREANAKQTYGVNDLRRDLQASVDKFEQENRKMAFIRFERVWESDEFVGYGWDRPHARFHLTVR